MTDEIAKEIVSKMVCYEYDPMVIEKNVDIVAQALHQARQEGREEGYVKCTCTDNKWDCICDYCFLQAARERGVDLYRKGYEACRKDAVEVAKSKKSTAIKDDCSGGYTTDVIAKAIQELKPKE